MPGEHIVHGVNVRPEFEDIEKQISDSGLTVLPNQSEHMDDTYQPGSPFSFQVQAETPLGYPMNLRIHFCPTAPFRNGRYVPSLLRNEMADQIHSAFERFSQDFDELTADHCKSESWSDVGEDRLKNDYKLGFNLIDGFDRRIKEWQNVGFSERDMDMESLNKALDRVQSEMNEFRTEIKNDIEWNKVDPKLEFGTGVEWRVDNDTLYIRGEGATPGAYDRSDDYVGCPWKEYESQVKHIVIEEGVTHIHSVGHMRNLESVHLPDSCTAVCNRAFDGCRKLSDINMPPHLETIGYRAFSNAHLKELDLPDTVKMIDACAFKNVPLKRVEFNEGLETVKGAAFMGTELREANLKNGLKSMSNVFGFTHIHDISLPETVQLLTAGAFRNTDIRKVAVNSNLKVAGSVFLDSDVNTVSFGGKATRIPEQMCKGTVRLVHVDIGDSVKEIGTDSFSRCERLSKIDFPDSVEVIGRRAFARCSNLEKVSFGNGVKLIGNSSFAETPLKQVVLPLSTERIEKDAFRGCRDMDCVVMPASLRDIQDQAFDSDVHLKRLYIVGSDYDKETILKTFPYLDSFYQADSMDDLKKGNFIEVSTGLKMKEKIQDLADEARKVPFSVMDGPKKGHIYTRS